MSSNDYKKEGKEMMNSAKDQLSDASDKIKDKATKVGEKIADKSEELANNVRDKAKSANKELTGFVKKNPYIAVASAFITGWLISKIL